MKKITLITLVGLLVLITTAVPALAAGINDYNQDLDLNTFQGSVIMSLNSGKAFVNGLEVTGQKPILENGRILVPLRFLAENLQAKVDWHPAKQEVQITDGDKKILLTIGSKDMLVDGKKMIIDVPAILSNGTTYLPLRAIGDALGKTTEFNNDSKLIIDSNQPMDLNMTALNTLKATFDENYRVMANIWSEPMVLSPTWNDAPVQLSEILARGLTDIDLVLTDIENAVIIERSVFDLNQDGRMDEMYMIASPLGINRNYFTAPAFLLYAVSPVEKFHLIKLDFPPIDLTNEFCQNFFIDLQI